MNEEITSLNTEDLEYIVENLKQFDNFWNENILRQEFYNENSKYFVLKSNNEIIAFADLWFNIDEAHVMNIAVNENSRRKNYGTKLLEYLVQYAQSLNKNCITLEVNEKNIPAINLYRKMDFQEVGRRKKYYNNTDDAIIMTKNF